MRRFIRTLIEKHISGPLKQEIHEQYSGKIRELQERVEAVDARTTSYYRNRYEAIDSLADYLVGAQVPGDYAEFGVFQGAVFSYAHKVMAPLFPGMKFRAFDSFEGLPALSGIDCAETYSSSFYEGQFECSLDDFNERLERACVEKSRVEITKGWFDEVLPGKTVPGDGDSIAAAWVDCDLYQSTVPVLSYVTRRLTTGSVVLFDDWRCFRNLPGFGQQRACREWLEANPRIHLNVLFSFGWHGIAFTVDIDETS